MSLHHYIVCVLIVLCYTAQASDDQYEPYNNHCITVSEIRDTVKISPYPHPKGRYRKSFESSSKKTEKDPLKKRGSYSNIHLPPLYNYFVPRS